MMERFDVIVVGAGPSGNAAAYTLAKAGLSVLQIERGESPGTKNVQGAILYSDALERIIPDFRDSAPLERHVVEQRLWLMDENAACTGITYRDERFSEPPYNRYTIIRARFDRWFSDQVKKAGAELLCETTVTGLLRDPSGKVIGVQTERAHGDILADCVILADGANSLVGSRAGIRPDVRAQDMALAVKEVLFLPKEVVESRFGLAGSQGTVIEIAGAITHGMVGTGFLYTNKDSISVGIGCMLGDLKRQKLKPAQLLEGLKRHPSVRPLIADAEMKEYAAHLIPEGGYKALPQVFGNGWMIVGDSAGFVNGIHREGSNLAMTTGRLAAETLIDLHKAGRLFNAGNLADYQTRLDASVVMADLKKYQHVPDLLHSRPHILDLYPRILGDAAREMLTVNGVPKREKQGLILKQLRQKRSLLGMLGDAWQFWKAFR
ncbi:MAG: FAD-dependent oxidoreductase [Zoogloea sp.]|nr:FAD-dependent oxidoreductase [Zoogloea sp.]